MTPPNPIIALMRQGGPKLEARIIRLVVDDQASALYSSVLFSLLRTTNAHHRLDTLLPPLRNALRV